jgi:hypothetical protein
MSVLYPMPVHVERGRGVWRLIYAEDCPQCGARHIHGGGSLDAPPVNPPGARIADCPSDHKPFRPDCLGEKAGGRRRCRVRHIPEQTVIELVFAEPLGVIR